MVMYLSSNDNYAVFSLELIIS